MRKRDREKKRTIEEGGIEGSKREKEIYVHRKRERDEKNEREESDSLR